MGLVVGTPIIIKNEECRFTPDQRPDQINFVCLYFMLSFDD